MTVKKKDVEETITISEGGEVPITVKVPDTKEPPTLTEKLKDFAPKRTRAPRKRPIKGKQIDANLISKLAPTLVATFVATYSRQLTKEPYKVCAPSQQEVMTIISPLFNILSRQIEITGQASETVIDLITCAIASIIFGTRAYVTYATIKEHENGKPLSNDGTTTPSTSRPGSSGNGTGGISKTNNPSTRQSEQVSPASTDDPTNVGDANSDDVKRDAALFNDLFSRDIEGRVRLGLLPARIPANNG